jgi:hypothetical protein
LIGAPRSDLALLKFAHAFEQVTADLRQRSGRGATQIS